MKVTGILQENQNIQFKKEDIQSIDKVKTVVKKLLCIVMFGEPITSFKLLTPENYSDENDDYQLSNEFYNTFKNSADDCDDLKACDLVRLVVLLQFIFSKIKPMSITVLDFLEANQNKISKILIELSTFAKFVEHFKDDTLKVLSHLSDEKAKQDNILKDVYKKEKYFNDNGISLDSIRQELQVLNNKLSCATEKNKVLQDRFEDISKEHEFVKQSNASIETECELIFRENEDLKSAIERYRKLTEYDKETATTILQDMQYFYKEQMQIYVDDVKRRYDLEFRLNNSKEYESQIAMLNKKIEDIIGLNDKYESIRNNLSKLQQSSFKESTKKLQKKIQSIKPKIASKTEQRNRLVGKINSKNENIQMNLESIRNYEVDIETKNRTISQLTEQIEKTKQSIKQEKIKQIDADKEFKEKMIHLKELKDGALSAILNNYQTMKKF